MVDNIKQTRRAPGVRDDHAGVAVGKLQGCGGKGRRVSLTSFCFALLLLALLYSIDMSSKAGKQQQRWGLLPEAPPL